MTIKLLRRIALMSLTALLCATTAHADEFPAINTTALSTHDQNAPIGFAASVTGGNGENCVTVTTFDALKSAMDGTGKKTIYVSGTLYVTGQQTIQNTSNKTIIGLPGATLSNTTLDTSDKAKSGILYLKRCTNIIVRNITFLGAGAYDYDGNDNLTVDNCQNIWIDHCDFQDGVDGNFDCKNQSDNICVSWCRFRYLKAPTAGGSGGSNDHRFTNLWGSSDKASDDEGKLNTTFVCCWWDEGCKQRMPRVRFGKVHILNCLYSSSVADYCIGAGYKSNIYVENSCFNAQSRPWNNYATSGSYTDYNIQLTGNLGASNETSSSGAIAQFVPSYAYTAYAANDVQSVVSNSTNGAGATLTFGTGGSSDPEPVAAPAYYSWESPSGTPVEVGGTATYQHGDATNRVNYQHGSYFTLCLNGKKANIDDSDASTNAGYINVALDKALAEGDKIYITAYISKNSSVKSSAYLVYSNGQTADSGDFGDEANIGLGTPGAVTTKSVTVTAAAAGSTSFKMTRGSTGTNLYITKLQILPAAVTTTIGSAGYATFSSAYALDFASATGVKAYVATGVEDGGVTMAKVEGSVPAATGLLLQRVGSDDISIPVVPSASAPAANLLRPAVTTTNVAASTAGCYHYVFARQGGVVGFYNLASATNVSAGKAYLETTTALSSPRLDMLFDDNDDMVTGISSTANGQWSTFNDSAVWYTLDGRRLMGQPTRKGLYIVNGKKVVVK